MTSTISKIVPPTTLPCMEYQVTSVYLDARELLRALFVTRDGPLFHYSIVFKITGVCTKAD